MDETSLPPSLSTASSTLSKMATEVTATGALLDSALLTAALDDSVLSSYGRTSRSHSDSNLNDSSFGRKSVCHSTASPILCSSAMCRQRASSSAEVGCGYSAVTSRKRALGQVARSPAKAWISLEMP